MSRVSRTSPSGSRPGPRPRVETYPAYVDTYGPETVELTRRAGLELDDWQQDSVGLALSIRSDAKWSCFEYCEWVSRQDGKGAIGEARVLAGLFLVKERLILWSAHEYKTAMEAHRRIVWLLGNLGEQVSDELIVIGDSHLKVINTNGKEGIERLDTGQRLRFVARSKGSGRGFSADCNIIDEAFAYTSTQQEALMPTMSARPNPQILYLSSPPLTGDTGDVMYALRRRGDPTAPRGPQDPPWQQDPALGYRDWGLPGSLDNLTGVDLDDETLWAQTNPAYGRRISREHVARERRSMTDEGFARERLGIWPRQAGADDRWLVVTENQWLALLDRTSRMLDPITLAVDVTPDRTWAAIGAAGPRAAGGRLVDVIEHRPGTAWVIPRLRELAARHRPLAVVSSDRAIRDAAEQSDERAKDGLRLGVILAGAGDIVGSSARMYDGVAGSDPTGRDIWHLGQPMLTAAVAGATKRPIGDGWGWNRRSMSTDICPLVAVSLAIWALGTPRVQTQQLAPFALT